MKPAMYIFINRGLDMSPGKIAAQAGHAAVEAYRLSDANVLRYQWEAARPVGDIEYDHPIHEAWYRGGHYAKYVMEARDSLHMLHIEAYLQVRGFRTVMIYDEGHTEIEPIQPTALGVALVDKDDPHTEASFSSFALYRDKRPSQYESDREAYERLKQNLGHTPTVTSIAKDWLRKRLG